MHTELIEAIAHNNVLPVSELRPYLWKDEINDPFLLTKHMELYLYSGYTPDKIDNAVLGCYCWTRKIASQLRKMGVTFDDWSTDDGIYTFKTYIANLPLILSLGAFKRRPSKNGKWVEDKERRLGHRILPYHYCKSELLTGANLGEVA